MTTDFAFSQGARCGHIEGNSHDACLKSAQEIRELGFEAAQNQELGSLDATLAWAHGYIAGFNLRADGIDLPKVLSL